MEAIRRICFWLDLLISQVFDGLGRAPEFFGAIDALHKDIRKAFGFIGFQKIKGIASAQGRELEESMIHLFDTLTQMREHNWRQICLDGVASAPIKAAQQCQTFLSRQQEITKQQPATVETSRAEPFREQIYELDQLLRALYKLRHFSSSMSAKAANRPAVLLVGAAGSGKTHLFCDVAQRRIKNAQPTVILLGQQFGNTEPWKQLIELLNLKCKREELLGDLDAAAQACETRAFDSDRCLE